MFDFNRLKGLVNENTNKFSGIPYTSLQINSNQASSSSAESTTTTFHGSNYFGNLFSFSKQTTNLDTEPAEGWFREADSDPFCPKLSRTQRIVGFMICLLMGGFLMLLASFYIPVIILKSRKFVLLFSLGSIFFIASFSLLWGVRNHLKHLFNVSRLPFTLGYFSTLIATIYFAMIVKSVILTLIFAVLQILTLVWYVISYIPGGQTGLKFFAKLFYSFASRTVTSTLQV